MLKGTIGVIAALPSRRARTAGSAGQREMRAEGALFLRNSQGGHFVVDGSSQGGEWRAGFHADPKNAGRFWSGEESVAAEAYFGCLAADGGKRLLNLFYGCVGLFADEFQCDV